MRRALKIWLAVLAVSIAATMPLSAQQQRYRSERRVIRGGLEQKPDSLAVTTARLADSLSFASDSLSFASDSLRVATDSTAIAAADSLAVGLRDSLTAARDSLTLAVRDTLSVAGADSLTFVPRDTLAVARLDSLEAAVPDSLAAGRQKRERRPLLSDSMSLPKVCWASAVLPGFGQIYNKQYWKLPILYSTLGASLGMFIHENNRYKPLKRQFEEMTNENLSRTEELNRVQTDLIRTNTRRELYLAAAIASYVYFLGDAAVRYSTNEVSGVQRATTLAMICPGAGQIYNKSYWRVPIVLGGLATTVYCIDWNNRGYQRFKKAYRLRADFDQNPDNYPDGSTDEFQGRYSATFLKNLRDSYRRNRDLCIILTAGMYILQIIDAHVDAHLRDFDISDDLSMNVYPMVDYAYAPSLGRTSPTFGMNLCINF